MMVGGWVDGWTSWLVDQPQRGGRELTDGVYNSRKSRKAGVTMQMEMDRQSCTARV